ncbi:hypothetical protein G5V57_30800 [Nordella sp. HKS 07]|uniref:hypothetical protein n=1 Tax=Nordella sp. HKS 07 TaxID=2712222 RepID=UPI0013E1DBD1|nr:hypothetical protein [Nordella sp. HKS 07]QIG51719.1 hypothetical protein G5V57_30800 [Nordella sp. HKS 07]
MAGFNPAMEAAIQSIHATAVRRLVWMAGSKPGYDEWREQMKAADPMISLGPPIRMTAVSIASPQLLMAALEAAIQPIHPTAV